MFERYRESPAFIYFIQLTIGNHLSFLTNLSLSALIPMEEMIIFKKLITKHLIN